MSLKQMMNASLLSRSTVVGAIGAAGIAVAAGAAGVVPLSYTAPQASRGAAIYRANCSQCHGENLGNGEFAPPLKGGNFRAHWRGKPMLGLYTKVTTMPPGNAGSLGDPAYRDVTAYILSANGIPAGNAEFVANGDRMKAQIVPN